MKSLVPIFLAVIILGTVASAQDESLNPILKTVVLNQVVEFVPRAKEETADFGLVDIKYQGKTLKTFAANLLLFPEIVGSFKAADSEYVLYRSYMGQGGCGSGSLYVIRFQIDSRNQQVQGVFVSPALTDCLGDGVTFGYHVSPKNQWILSVYEHDLNLDDMTSWTSQKSVKPATKKKN